MSSWPAPGSAAASTLTNPREAAATLEALRPPHGARPLVAILGANGGTETETTDYVMPYSLLRRADVADVVALATAAGPVKLFPALSVQPDATTAQFDAQHPEGADYVIVPAMSRDDDPVVLAWLRAQASRGAIIIGVCAGAKVVAAAGLLDGRRATTHWYYRQDMLDAHPAIRFVRDRRYVVDANAATTVATTTGITASMPMMLTLIEAIAGHAQASSVARELGVATWDARHDTDAFIFSRPFAATVLRNAMRFWSRDEFVIPLETGIDEVSLALAADAWSRTYRSRATTLAATHDTVTTRNGLRIVPDDAGASAPASRQLEIPDLPPAQVLDEALAGISQRYGANTAATVATQLEYPRHFTFR